MEDPTEGKKRPPLETMKREAEQFMNELSADQKVFRLVLQCFLLNMAAKAPAGLDVLASIKDQVLGSIDLTQPLAEDRQGGERHKQLTRMRAERFFLDLEEATGTASKPAPAAKN